MMYHDMQRHENNNSQRLSHYVTQPVAQYSSMVQPFEYEKSHTPERLIVKWLCGPKYCNISCPPVDSAMKYDFPQ